MDNPERMGWMGVAVTSALLSSGCISTEPEPVVDGPLCQRSAPLPAARESVVLVSTDLAAVGLIKCSGVLIAPTIVLTNLSCVTLPSGYGPSDLDAPPGLTSEGRPRSWWRSRLRVGGRPMPYPLARSEAEKRSGQRFSLSSALRCAAG